MSLGTSQVTQRGGLLVHLLGLEPRMPFGRQVLNLVGLPISLEVQVRVFEQTPSGPLALLPTLQIDWP